MESVWSIEVWHKDHQLGKMLLMIPQGVLRNLAKLISKLILFHKMKLKKLVSLPKLRKLEIITTLNNLTLTFQRLWFWLINSKSRKKL